ncbi:MAG: protein translocase subunit SecDF [Bacillaceae bacterium]|nr:protein translocase subunit SecDF [Bacillaceae bacterium]
MVKRNRLIAFLLIVFISFGIMIPTAKPLLESQKLGLDLQGGFEVLYQVEPVNEGDKITKEVLSSTVEALDKRINVLGVSEPSIEIEGGNRIRVQLAGIEDQNQAREILSTTAELTFRDADDNKLLDGSDLVQGAAKQSYDATGKPNVVLKLKDAGKFAEATRKVLQSDTPVMVIWLDFEEGKDSYREEAKKANPKYISAPVVDEVINSTDVEIRGNFTVEEAKTLADLLNAGALPVKLKEIYSTSVGAQFGEDALQKTVQAGIVGILLVFLFMIGFYRLPGLIATITLLIYIYLVLAVNGGLNAVLTLPGIAALLLGVGMAVDANVITYERMKEEIKVGRTLQAAFKEGNKSSFITIFDANLTTIISAAVLFYFGTSSVKGFATMLIVSVILSFVTNVYLTRLFLGLLVHSRYFDGKPGWFGVKREDIKDIKEGYDIYTLPTRFDKWDFVRFKNIFFTFSVALLLIGAVFLAVFKLNLSIDFTSGTRIEIMADHPLTTEEIEKQLDNFNIKPDQIVFSGDNQESAVVRMKGDIDQKTVNRIKSHFAEEYGHDPSISVVTPMVGQELVKNAIMAVAIASLGIILYLAFRFEIKMGIASIIALLHDAFFVIAIFSIVRMEVDLTIVAAVLTIIGYSVNDTIVTFDRIRENMRMKRRIRKYDEIVEIVNRSLRQVFTRSINTMLTVLLPVVLLLVMGSEAIRNFSLAMFVGLIAGGYSSLFIAAQLWLIWKGRELKKKGVLITYKEKKKFSDEPQV